MGRITWGSLLFSFALTLAAQPSGLSSCAKAVDRGDFAIAVRNIQALLKSQPESVPGRVLLARAYMGLNDANSALKELHRALRDDPASLDALYYFSKLTAILSQQEFGAVARISPDSARMHQIRAEGLEAQGDAAGAEREYLAALEKRPGTAYIMNALGDLKRHQKQFADALLWYQKVLEKDPHNYDALYGIGVCHRVSQSPEDALAFFRRALEADPSSIAAKLAVGESLLLTGNAREALPLLEESAASDPQFRRAQFVLGRAYQALGRKEDARRAFERAKQLTKEGDPDEGAADDK